MKLLNLMNLYMDEKRREAQEKQGTSFISESAEKVEDGNQSEIKDDETAKDDAGEETNERMEVDEGKKIDDRENVDDEVMDMLSKNRMILYKAEENVDAVPLNVKLPEIVDWETVEENCRDIFKIVRADESVTRYRNIFQLFRNSTREDVEDIYRIGKRKFSRTTGPYECTRLLMDALTCMFDNHKFQLQSFSPVTRWNLYESCGVYQIVMYNGNLEFYLVERKYNHSVGRLRGMLNIKVADKEKSSSMAQQVLKKIQEQLESINKSS